jgi:hypothetical protein
MFGEVTRDLHDPAAWTGYPQVIGLDEVSSAVLGPVAPCAVTALGDGVWFYHRPGRTSGTADADTLFVVAPCACGRYRETDVRSITDLADALTRALDTSRPCDTTCVPHQREKDAEFEAWFQAEGC